MARSLKAAINNKDDNKEKKKALPGNSGDQTTFVIEALLLLMCLMMVIAVSVSVISTSVKSNDYYAHKEAAISLASNIAEIFAADPTIVEERYEDGDLSASCLVTSKNNAGGILYDISISVEWKDTKIWWVDTSKYVPNGIPAENITEFNIHQPSQDDDATAVIDIDIDADSTRNEEATNEGASISGPKGADDETV